MQVHSVNGGYNPNFKAFIPSELAERLIPEAKRIGILGKYNSQVSELTNYGNQVSYFTVIKENGNEMLAMANPKSYVTNPNNGNIEFVKSNLYCNQHESLIEQFMSVKKYMIDEAQKFLDLFTAKI